MKTIRVYDPPMCCSTGVCGPSVDPEPVRFAADLKWLKSRGVTVERFNRTGRLRRLPAAWKALRRAIDRILYMDCCTG